MGKAPTCRERVNPPRVALGTKEAGQAAVRGLLDWMNIDPEHEAMADTPRRVVEAWQEQLAGYEVDPARLLGVAFEAGCDEAVTLRRIPLHSTCEHHLLPFAGWSTVAYIPGPSGQVVGISKLARLVECFARRLQLQERLTSQVADALVEHLAPAGVAVAVEATHLCMVCRGVKKPGSALRTVALRGAYREEPALRAEFMEGV